jgi:hypothetical protein
MPDVKNETIQEAYEAPTIEDVPVRSEERLLTSCKNTTAGSGPNAFPNSCIFFPACVGFANS